MPQAWLLALLGGLMIGFASALMLLGLGRIAGVSGLAARAAGLGGADAPPALAWAFVLGLPLGAFVMARALGGITLQVTAGTGALVLAGLLVGYGTRLGSGCTSGHGVCGVSRLSRRSVTATMIFMASGIITVAVMRLMGVT